MVDTKLLRRLADVSRDSEHRPNGCPICDLADLAERAADEPLMAAALCLRGALIESNLNSKTRAEQVRIAQEALNATWDVLPIPRVGRQARRIASAANDSRVSELVSLTEQERQDIADALRKQAHDSGAIPPDSWQIRYLALAGKLTGYKP